MIESNKSVTKSEKPNVSPVNDSISQEEEAPEQLLARPSAKKQVIKSLDSGEQSSSIAEDRRLHNQIFGNGVRNPLPNCQMQIKTGNTDPERTEDYYKQKVSKLKIEKDAVLEGYLALKQKYDKLKETSKAKDQLIDELQYNLCQREHEKYEQPNFTRNSIKLKSPPNNNTFSKQFYMNQAELTRSNLDQNIGLESVISYKMD